MKNKCYVDQKDMLAQVIFCLIVAACLGYSVGLRSFAKIHVFLPGVNIPVFIGEMLLMACACLWMRWRYLSPQPWAWWEKGIALYIGFMGYKVVEGIIHGGGLALRNAALFYYPFFAALTFSVFKPAMITPRAVAGIWIILFLLRCAGITGEFLYPYWALSLVLTLSMPRWWQKILGIALVFFLYPTQDFFKDSKSYVLGDLAGWVFIFFCLSAAVPWKKRARMAVFLVLLAVLAVGFIKFSNPVHRQSLSAWSRLSYEFQKKDAIVQERKKDFTPKTLVVRLYRGDDWMNPPVKKAVPTPTATVSEGKKTLEKKIEPSSLAVPAKPAESKKEALIRQLTVFQAEGVGLVKGLELSSIEGQVIVNEKNNKDIGRLIEVLAGSKEILEKDRVEQAPQVLNELKEAITAVNNSIVTSRGKEVDQENMLFRLFIWRDMMEEVLHEKALLGLSWGHPQRSISIEVLNMAEGEWMRAGWITPHNSYLHLIYRAGIVGFMIIVLIVFLILRLAVDFVRARSWRGIIAASILVYWAVSANFLVFLEFPYFAIPFWSFLGVLLALRRDLRPVAT